MEGGGLRRGRLNCNDGVLVHRTAAAVRLLKFSGEKRAVCIVGSESGPGIFGRERRELDCLQNLELLGLKGPSQEQGGKSDFQSNFV